MTLLDVRLQDQDDVGALLVNSSSPNQPDTVLFGRQSGDGFEWALVASPTQEEPAKNSKLSSEISWSVGHISVRYHSFKTSE